LRKTSIAGSITHPLREGVAIPKIAFLQRFCAVFWIGRKAIVKTRAAIRLQLGLIPS
jgi:hypothetical protein